MKKIRYSVLGVVLLLFSFWGYSFFIQNKKTHKRVVEKHKKVVFTEIVKNSKIPIIIKERGNLEAKNRLSLYSEVQGVLKTAKKEFRVGVAYKKGETLLSINSDEHIATLKAQKSVFQNLLVSIMPDLRMDYPESFEKWETYLKSFDVNSSIKTLPAPSSDKEKYFITAKDIYTTYYNIKNLEVRFEKYNIRAPFDGIITEVNVNTGALVRAGQKMGEFINTDVYELELSINAALANDLRVGKKVFLKDLSNTIALEGKVIRINGKIDAASQTLPIFIEVRGSNLKEGMYLEASVFAREVPESYEISRKLLINREKVFVLKDSVLESKQVTPIYFKENTVIVKGLVDGTELVSKPVIGAFVGMSVERYNESKSVE